MHPHPFAHHENNNNKKNSHYRRIHACALFTIILPRHSSSSFIFFTTNLSLFILTVPHHTQYFMEKKPTHTHSPYLYNGHKQPSDPLHVYIWFLIALIRSCSHSLALPPLPCSLTRSLARSLLFLFYFILVLFPKYALFRNHFHFLIWLIFSIVLFVIFWLVVVIVVALSCFSWFSFYSTHSARFGLVKSLT